MRRIWPVATVATLLLACATPGGGPADVSGGTVKAAAVASGPFTETFNPLVLSSANAVGYATQSIYEQLLVDDFAHGVIRPWLVTSYTWGDEGRSLTLKVRQGVRWSNGKAFTADDVAFTFELLRKYPALNTNGLPLAGAGAPRPDEAVIKFSEPSYQVQWWLTKPVPKHVWENIADPVKYVDKAPVSTGPYVLKSFTPQVITLEKNPRYWQQGLPKVQTVQYLAFDSDTSMIAAVAAGQVDWIGTTADPGPIARRDPAHIHYWVTKPSPSIDVILPNHQVYPLNLLAVRKAISMAIDRENLTRVGLSGLNEPIVSPTGLDVKARADYLAPAYRETRYGAGNPSGARSTLTDAGFRAGPDGIMRTPDGKRLSLELLLPTSSPFGDFVRASQVIVAQLRQAGIEMTVKTESPVSWRSDTGLGSFQLTIRALGGTNNVYDLFNRIFSQELTAPVGKNAQRNYERYLNPEAATLLKQYAASAPGSKGEQQALAGLQRLMVEDVPVIPLFFSGGAGLWRTDHATGFPTASNPFAVPEPESTNAELVLLHLQATGK